MNGWIDEGGRALVRIAIKATADSSSMPMEAWLDTGFTGELVLSRAKILSLKLPQSGTVSAELGDGSAVVLETFTCLIEWFGRQQEIEVVANDGQYPLLGVGLLRHHKLIVDYPSRTIVVE